MKRKLVYYFGGGSADGKAAMKMTLGGKGAGLAEMVRLGLPVPAGFTLSADLCAYYEEHVEDSYTLPPKARIAYMVVAALEEAQDALRRLEAGESFGDLARELSVDETASAHGGRIGWVSPGELLGELEDAVFSAEPGSVVGPIETGSGWFVVQVLESRPAVPVPYETVQPRARRSCLWSEAMG